MVIDGGVVEKSGLEVVIGIIFLRVFGLGIREVEGKDEGVFDGEVSEVLGFG